MILCRCLLISNYTFEKLYDLMKLINENWSMSRFLLIKEKYRIPSSDVGDGRCVNSISELIQ